MSTNTNDNVTHLPVEEVGQNSTGTNYVMEDYIYTQFVYESYGFEHPIYLYIWEILVIISVVIAMLFLIIMTRRKLRSVTSYILCAISISDSLTGLVTIPTYIMASLELQEPTDLNSADYNQSFYLLDSENYDYEQGSESNSTFTLENLPTEAMNAYMLDATLCTGFMISRHFLSKMFHTISIWLTVFLGIQRCMSVWLPFTARAWFSNRKTIIIFISVVILSLLLHGFHVFHDKKVDGFCTWVAVEDCSDGSCVQVTLELIFRHLAPCIILTVTTVLMVRKLAESSFQAHRSVSVKKFQRGSEVVDDEHRQVSRIVLGIVIVFLITEVPYGLFLLYAAAIENQDISDLKTNRVIHIVYEITMVVSFNANFVIYMAFNARFRRELKKRSCCRRKRPVLEAAATQSHSKSTSSQPPATEMSTVT